MTILQWLGIGLLAILAGYVLYGMAILATFVVLKSWFGGRK